jgi:hypothetical protein
MDYAEVFYLLSALSFSCLALWVYAARVGEAHRSDHTRRFARLP